MNVSWPSATTRWRRPSWVLSFVQGSGHPRQWKAHLFGHFRGHKGTHGYHPVSFQIFHFKLSSYWGIPIFGNPHLMIFHSKMPVGHEATCDWRRKAFVLDDWQSPNPATDVSIHRRKTPRRANHWSKIFFFLMGGIPNNRNVLLFLFLHFFWSVLRNQA